MGTARNLANFKPSSAGLAGVEDLDSSATQLFGMRNRLINGNMAINQRASSSYTDNGYTLDRWKIYNSGGTYALSQQTFAQGSQPAFGLKHFMRVVRSSPSAILYLSQLVEDVSYYDNVTVTVSFYAKASGAITLPLRVTQEFGSGGSSGVQCGIVNHSVTTTLQRFSGTYTIPSLAGKTIGTNSHLEVTFDIPATTETIEITGVQLEIGSVATPYDYRNYDTELDLCYRYCYAWRTDSSGYTNYSRFPVSFNTSTTECNTNIFLPKPMRNTAYSITWNNKPYMEYFITGGGATGTGMALNTDANGSNWVNIRFTGMTGTALTTGGFSGIRMTNALDAVLVISTEL
jgi:hypothetical protein